MRILTLDIETTPIDAYVWGLWQQNVQIDRIKKPTYMLSWCAKWLGDKVVHHRDVHDEDMHHALYELLKEADAVISYNGEKFDMRHIRREFIEFGYNPLRPTAQIDLLKTVKSQFNFPSNKLDYVAGVLLGVHKLDTGGFALWPACMAGDTKARNRMRRYNIRDVRITERLYRKLRGWITNHPHTGPLMPLDDADQKYTCPVCTSSKIRTQTARRTRCFTIRQNQCGSCGHWYDGQRRKFK